MKQSVIASYKVTRAESGSHKYSLAQAGGAWDGGNISGTDIGEVKHKK